MSDIRVFHQVKSHGISDGEKWKVGDIIQFSLSTNEKIEARCERIEEDGAIFCATHCLKEKRPVVSDYKKLDWDKSELRKYLNEILINTFPFKIKDKMIPIYKDDLLAIPSIEDVFGDWGYEKWKPIKPGLNNRNWKLMQDVQYRIKGGWYWLRSFRCYSSGVYRWCGVAIDGSASATSGSYAFGFAPAFKLSTN